MESPAGGLILCVYIAALSAVAIFIAYIIAKLNTASKIPKSTRPPQTSKPNSSLSPKPTEYPKNKSVEQSLNSNSIRALPMNDSLSVRPKRLISEQERMFFLRLRDSVGNRYEIFPQIRLESILSKEGRLPDEVYPVFANGTVDFVLAHPSYLDTILVIELDDTSHQQVTTRERDSIKDRLLADAKIPLLRIRTTDKLEATELRQKIEEKIGWKVDTNVTATDSSPSPSA